MTDATFSRRGFQGYRKPEEISDEALDKALGRISTQGLFIYWTGKPYRARPGSLRSESLACLKVSDTPVPLSDWIRLAARAVSAEAKIGYRPEVVRQGLFQHRGSKPTVYLCLYLDEVGNYRSAVNVVGSLIGSGIEAKFPQGIKRGDIIIPKEEKVEPAQIEAKGSELVETEASKTKRVRKGKSKDVVKSDPKPKGKASKAVDAFLAKVGEYGNFGGEPRSE